MGSSSRRKRHAEAQAMAVAKGRLARNREEVLPDLPRVIPARAPERMLALFLWIERLGVAFRIPLEGHLFQAYSLKTYRWDFLHDNNVREVYGTLVKALKNFENARASTLRKRIAAAEGLGGGGGDVCSGRMTLPTGGSPAHIYKMKLWEAVMGSRDFRDYLTLKVLKAWASEWQHERVTPARRSYFWEKLQRCSELMRVQATALNWSPEFEEQWLQVEAQCVLKGSGRAERLHPGVHRTVAPLPVPVKRKEPEPEGAQGEMQGEETILLPSGESWNRVVAQRLMKPVAEDEKKGELDEPTVISVSPAASELGLEDVGEMQSDGEEQVPAVASRGLLYPGMFKEEEDKLLRVLAEEVTRLQGEISRLEEENESLEADISRID